MVGRLAIATGEIVVRHDGRRGYRFKATVDQGSATKRRRRIRCLSRVVRQTIPCQVDRANAQTIPAPKAQARQRTLFNDEIDAQWEKDRRIVLRNRRIREIRGNAVGEDLSWHMRRQAPTMPAEHDFVQIHVLRRAVRQGAVEGRCRRVLSDGQRNQSLILNSEDLFRGGRRIREVIDAATSRERVPVIGGDVEDIGAVATHQVFGVEGGRRVGLHLAVVGSGGGKSRG